MPMPAQKRLEDAMRRVAHGRRIIEKQRDFAFRAEATGGDPETFYDLLHQFERTQAIFEKDLEDIMKRQS